MEPIRRQTNERQIARARASTDSKTSPVRLHLSDNADARAFLSAAMPMLAPFRPPLAPFQRRRSRFCSRRQRCPLAPFRRCRSHFCSAAMTPMCSHLSDTAARAFVPPPTASPPRLHLHLASPPPRLTSASPRLRLAGEAEPGTNETKDKWDMVMKLAKRPSRGDGSFKSGSASINEDEEGTGESRGELGAEYYT
ncbi:hypothetical protein B0H13DRAFT_2350249 [Mycena leptocephala]|nr:hypothetical protein B0H13DRAFT_2350249 [Mycena leptocephala]